MPYNLSRDGFVPHIGFGWVHPGVFSQWTVSSVDATERPTAATQGNQNDLPRCGGAASISELRDTWGVRHSEVLGATTSLVSSRRLLAGRSTKAPNAATGSLYPTCATDADLAFMNHGAEELGTDRLSCAPARKNGSNSNSGSATLRRRFMLFPFLSALRLDRRVSGNGNG